MAIQIGGKTESGFRNPIGLMSDCHRRIKKFLSIMITIMRQTHGGSMEANQKAALETCLRYFREAAPNHTMDEEQSLFPRMRNFENDLKASDMQCLDHLEQEHAEVDISHHNVDRLGNLWLSQGWLTSEDSDSFSRALGKLSLIYKRHIDLEEHQIFPLALKILPDTEVAAIGREMALRRNVDFDRFLFEHKVD
jgi:hemerythrin-like domain-containing protein